MAEHTNFVWVLVKSHLGDNEGDIGSKARAGFTWEGGSVEKTFTVPGDPVGEGCVFVQAYDVSNGRMQIRINGKALPSWDVPVGPVDRWFLWVDRIPAEMLKKGQNTIRFEKSGNDNVLIRGVLVQWREKA